MEFRKFGLTEKRRLEMTLLDRLVEYVDKNPEATDVEIAEALNTSKKCVQTYIRRLRNREIIKTVVDDKGQRQILVLEMPELTPVEYKKGIYEMMVNKYLEDFKSLDSFQDRIEIGKMIVRILEKL